MDSLAIPQSKIWNWIKINDMSIYVFDKKLQRFETFAVSLVSERMALSLNTKYQADRKKDFWHQATARAPNPDRQQKFQAQANSKISEPLQLLQ